MTIVNLLLGAATWPLTCLGWITFCRRAWPAAYRALGGGDLVTRVLESIWRGGPACAAIDFAFGYFAWGTGVAIASAAAFLAWLWRRRRWGRAVRAAGAKSRARIEAMARVMRDLAPAPLPGTALAQWRRTLCVLLSAAALAACGGSLDAGRVIAKQYKPGYYRILWQPVYGERCEPGRSTEACTTYVISRVPIQEYQPPAWGLELKDGKKTGWTYVAESDYARVRLGQWWGIVRPMPQPAEIGQKP